MMASPEHRQAPAGVVETPDTPPEARHESPSAPALQQAPGTTAGDARHQLLASMEEAGAPSRISQPRYATSLTGSPMPARTTWAPMPASLPEPAVDPSIVTISDRRVRLPGAGQEAPSLYGLARAWVRNAPDIPIEQELFKAAPSGRGWREEVDGPRPSLGPPPIPPPLLPGPGGAAPSVDVLLQHNLAHWKACRARVRSLDRRLPAASLQYLAGLMASAVPEAMVGEAGDVEAAGAGDAREQEAGEEAAVGAELEQA
ncbi:hypothetical protein ACKKBF_B10750 [Auxenochlorella protothecoides x Auxenochlorella symbiontica]